VAESKHGCRNFHQLNGKKCGRSQLRFCTRELLDFFSAHAGSDTGAKEGVLRKVGMRVLALWSCVRPRKVAPGSAYSPLNSWPDAPFPMAGGPRKSIPGESLSPARQNLADCCNGPMV